MNGIDTGAAALLASRVSTLNPVGSQGSAGAAQTGVSALATGTTTLPDAQTAATPQDSAQTVLSAVALALDAIIRSGGEATPAVVGQAPVWSDPDAAGGTASLPLPGMPGAATEVAALEAALLTGDAAALAQAAGDGNPAANLAAMDDADGASAAANAGGSGASGPSGADASAAAQAAQAVAGQSGPVAALAAALQQTVTGSGLFYESHLAQWLVGQRTPASLADEPQNRLVDASAQMTLDWAQGSQDADDVLWTETTAAGTRESAPAGPPPAPMRNAGPDATTANLASNTVLVRANGALADASLLPATQDASAATTAVHAAVIPLVRQQLDLLATGEFRWTGEAWPGVRLDWSIQQDRFDPRDGRSGGADPGEMPWRTRLTLALPSLGTVDAELTLSGDQLAVRVQANPGGAARLVAGTDVLRGRLEALGLALTGLAIREIGGAAPGSAEAARAASAYARAAAQTAAHSAGTAGSAAGSTGTQAGTHAGAQTATAATTVVDVDWELR